jgi:hypothetical protein
MKIHERGRLNRGGSMLETGAAANADKKLHFRDLRA